MSVPPQEVFGGFPKVWVLPPILIQLTSSPSKSVQSRVMFPPCLVITYLTVWSTSWVLSMDRSTFLLETVSSSRRTWKTKSENLHFLPIYQTCMKTESEHSPNINKSPLLFCEYLSTSPACSMVTGLCNLPIIANTSYYWLFLQRSYYRLRLIKIAPNLSTGYSRLGILAIKPYYWLIKTH